VSPNLVVTGAGGFIGRHVTSLLDLQGLAYQVITRASTELEITRSLEEADAVIHLAGVNRPSEESEFERGNTLFTQRVADALAAAGKRATIVLSSTSRAQEPHAYGRSKLGAEHVVREYAERTGARSIIFRLPNVFGKWSRPNYNSAVATFCHNITRDLPIQIHDPAVRLRLVYVDDVASALVAEATRTDAPAGATTGRVEPEFQRTVGEIVALLRQFRAVRSELVLPSFADDFVRYLYSTYVSFLPLEDTAYNLQKHEDPRGALAELLKSPWFGQVFLSRTKPGVTRGNHYHHTKTEKFVVVEGSALIRIRPIGAGSVMEIPVTGAEFRVVDIPPGHTHSITNVGEAELVTLFWSSEIFDQARPDTYILPV
jgi:UDP-2-acetamido-2,6-beta-L-arabino-hexul-4-ose reductase